jgi:hypothetical protein
MAVETRVKTIERPDRKARLFIISRDDGCYRFGGEKETEVDGYALWKPCDISGLYSTADDAERAAHHEVLWLRDLYSA